MESHFKLFVKELKVNSYFRTDFFNSKRDEETLWSRGANLVQWHRLHLSLSWLVVPLIHANASRFVWSNRHPIHGSEMMYSCHNASGSKTWWLVLGCFRIRIRSLHISAAMKFNIQLNWNQPENLIGRVVICFQVNYDIVIF